MTDDQRRRSAERQLKNMADQAEAGELRYTTRTRETPGAGKRIEWCQFTDPDGTVRTVQRVVDAPEQPMVVQMAVPDRIGRIMRTLLETDGVL